MGSPETTRSPGRGDAGGRRGRGPGSVAVRPRRRRRPGLRAGRGERVRLTSEPDVGTESSRRPVESRRRERPQGSPRLRARMDPASGPMPRTAPRDVTGPRAGLPRADRQRTVRPGRPPPATGSVPLRPSCGRHRRGTARRARLRDTADGVRLLASLFGRRSYRPSSRRRRDAAASPEDRPANDAPTRIRESAPRAGYGDESAPRTAFSVRLFGQACSPGPAAAMPADSRSRLSFPGCFSKSVSEIGPGNRSRADPGAPAGLVVAGGRDGGGGGNRTRVRKPSTATSTCLSGSWRRTAPESASAFSPPRRIDPASRGVNAIPEFHRRVGNPVG